MLRGNETSGSTVEARGPWVGALSFVLALTDDGHSAMDRCLAIQLPLVATYWKSISKEYTNFDA